MPTVNKLDIEPDVLASCNKCLFVTRDVSNHMLNALKEINARITAATPTVAAQALGNDNLQLIQNVYAGMKQVIDTYYKNVLAATVEKAPEFPG